MLLYHASMFDTDVLKPAFNITGETVMWDETESNHYLYATTHREDAVDQGFFSCFEKLANIDKIHSEHNKIEVTCSSVEDVEKLNKAIEELTVCVYCIEFDHRWIKVSNKVNGLRDEYKTHSFIRSFKEKSKVSFKDWSKRKTISIKADLPTPAFLSWK